VRRFIAATLVAVGLLTATAAWGGWLFATVSAPQRTRAVTAAVLDDPAARGELVSDLSGGLAGLASDAIAATTGDGSTYQVEADNPVLRGVVSTALENPSFQGLVSDAVVAVEADSTAAGDHSIVVPASVASDIVRAYVDSVAPGAAASVSVPAITASVTIPVQSLPPLARARTAAQTWPAALALLAGADLTAAALVAVNRRRVLRATSIWCLAAASVWLLLPAAVRWTGAQWFQGHAGIVSAASRAAFAGLPGPVVALAIAGGAGLLSSVRWRRHSKPILRVAGAVPEGTVA
jgi:hypothetical protein